MAHARIAVLRGADLTAEPGECVAVVGASGSGKSTLLHILGALDRPDSGRVVVAGRDVYALAEKERARVRAGRIGFVFQTYHLLHEMSVVENVMLPALAVSPLGMPSPAIRSRACELLASVGLDHRLDHRPMELSGGEQQRVAVARALMNDPEVILADEPTGNLDEKTGERVLDCLFSLAKRPGRTMVIVTHSRQVAERCHRVLRIEEGRLV
jgi:lipoprotein-releasing system ATP-binding protein